MYGWNINISPAPFAGGKSQPASRALHGIFAGTLIATRDGWRRVEELSVGDRVWTFDNALQPIAKVVRHDLWSDKDQSAAPPSPVLIPAGSLANEGDLMFLPNEGVMMECENGCDAMGDPFAVIPAAALEGICGISRLTAPENKTLYTVHFAYEEVIYIDSGLLLHCPAEGFDRKTEQSNYDLKTLDEARELLTDLDLAELALREANEDFFGEMATERVA